MDDPHHAPDEKAATASDSRGGPQHRGRGGPHPVTGGLALAALGAVYGDIGTSPLYALRECFHGVNGISVTPAHVLGVLSCIIWSLILVISVKYLAWLMRADNRGEGGILALMALVMRRSDAQGGTLRRGVLLVGILGAGLVFGDGIITPAISVLSAVEGLSIVTDAFSPFVVPIALGIIVILFLLQRFGTGRVGRIFGPVTLLWFLTLGVMGAVSLAQNPEVLRAINPLWAIGFVTENLGTTMLVLGSVFLAVTGGENLYMDMGHFGPGPIRLAWFTVVLPSLLLNYLGQGALLLRDPVAASHPFYALAPGWALLPLVGLAMLACAIASQAVISGIFSLTRQAIQLGYVPRMNVVHTSEQEIGQVYIPAMNWALLLGVVALVLGFGNSSALAGLYGVAVSILMLLGTLLGFVVYRQRFGWPLWAAGGLVGILLVIELSFVSANLLKVLDGGLIPLVLALVIFTLMTTWKRGRRILSERTRGAAMPLNTFLENLREHPPHRVPGTAIFMTGNAEGTPTALLHNLKHNKVLHERVIFLTIRVLEVPRAQAEERMLIEELAEDTWRVVVQHGFVETVTMPRIVQLAAKKGLELQMMQTTFFLGRETLIPTRRPGMALWRENLFALMSRNARSATAYFKLPPNRVVELGTQVEL